MKCKICGVEIERRGMNQKYCEKCGKEMALWNQKKWRLLNGEVKGERHCEKCGGKIPSHRHYCDKCLKEKYRDYQREYKRRIRAKK